MKILEKLKYFIINIDYLIAKSFLNKQSRFKDILIDNYNCLKKKISNIPFEPIEGVLNTELEDFNEHELTTHRSDFSNSISLGYIPLSIKSIINKHKDAIRKHLGENFLYEGPTIYENFNVEKKFSKYDIFSNIWHMDSHDGHKMIKIFVLLHDTTQEDGPLIYLSPSNTKKNWDKLRDRWTYDKKFLDHKYDEEVSFVGKKGSYLMLNTSISSHRASIPKTSRKILLFTLYPSWRKKKNRTSYNYN